MMLRGRVGDALTRCICGGTTSFALLAGAPCVARADDECARVTAAPDLPPAWSSALHDLTEQLAALGSTHCHPLTLTLEPVDGEMRLVAVADDGRRAERRVARPSLLVPIALGLAISIPGEPPAGAPAPAPGGTAAPPPASAVRTLPASAPAAPRSAPPFRPRPTPPRPRPPPHRAATPLRLRRVPCKPFLRRRPPRPPRPL